MPCPLRSGGRPGRAASTGSPRASIARCRPRSRRAGLARRRPHRPPLNDRSGATGILDAWTPLGPGNIGGRTRVVRYHPTCPTTIFAAGVSGGIWKTDDNGTTWRPTGDGLTNIAVNALVIDPQRPDVMFAGTGEGYFREEIRSTGLPLRGGGIFATRDGGRTWRAAARDRIQRTSTGSTISSSAPATAASLYAATRTGVWRSRDQRRHLDASAGGQRPRRLSRSGDSDGRANDVLFASCGSYEQATSTASSRPRASRGRRSGLARNRPWAARRSRSRRPIPTSSTPSPPATIPARSGNYRQALLAVYRSVRGGAAGTWETRVTNQDPVDSTRCSSPTLAVATIRDCRSASPNGSINMGWYTNVIAVDPRDPNRVWAAGVDWFRSDDGGATWGLASSMGTTPSATQTSGARRPARDRVPSGVRRRLESNVDRRQRWRALPHDQRAGRHRSPDRARPARPSRSSCSGRALNRGYGVTQFYHGAPFPDGERYFGGAQDNGTVLGIRYERTRRLARHLRRRRRLRRDRSRQSADTLRGVAVGRDR